ncbi:MAG TPA: TRAP transporter small permease [Ensifer sp.]|nr:TRAP transporter small permease [Ensifer sp.]
MNARLSALLEGLFGILFKVAMLALALMMLVIVCDVFMRYVLNHPLRGSYDLIEMLLPVVVFLGLPTVVAGRHDIVIDLIDGLAPARITRLLIVTANVLAVGILCVVVLAMWDPALQAYRYGDVKLQLNMPIWILWIPAFVGVVATILAAIKVLVEVVDGRGQLEPKNEGINLE